MIAFVVASTSNTFVIASALDPRMRHTDAHLHPMPSPHRSPLLARFAPLAPQLDLFGIVLSHRVTSSLTRTWRAARGPRSGTENLTRVLVAQCATLQVGPQRQTANGLEGQETTGVRATQHHFHAYATSPPGAQLLEQRRRVVDLDVGDLAGLPTLDDTDGRRRRAHGFEQRDGSPVVRES